MKLFQSLYSKVLGWSQHRHAPVYLAAMSFAESSFFPVPVAVMLLPMCLAKPERAYRLAALTLFYSVLGGVAGYLLGWGAYGLIEPFTQIYTAQLERAKDWFTDYGVWVVLMAGFSPVPYKIFTISAGLLAMPFVSFIVASIFGRASQFYLIAFLTNKYGPSMEPKIRQYIEWIGWAVVALAIAGILWLNLKDQVLRDGISAGMFSVRMSNSCVINQPWCVYAQQVEQQGRRFRIPADGP